MVLLAVPLSGSLSRITGLVLDELSEERTPSSGHHGNIPEFPVNNSPIYLYDLQRLRTIGSAAQLGRNRSRPFPPLPSSNSYYRVMNRTKNSGRNRNLVAEREREEGRGRPPGTKHTKASFPVALAHYTIRRAEQSWEEEGDHRIRDGQKHHTNPKFYGETSRAEIRTSPPAQI